MKINEIYTYKGNQYIIRNLGDMKVDTEKDGDYESKSEWVPAVIYSPVNKNWLYVRSKKDFELKFAKPKLP